jgi:anti-anti-sigma factor
MDTGGRTPTPELRLDRTDARGGVTTITVTGDIDMTTGDRFRRTLTHALEEPAVKRLLVDVGQLRFIDSNGITALIRAHRTAGERGIDFAITHAHGAIRSLFEMLGVYDMLTAEQEQA